MIYGVNCLAMIPGRDAGVTTFTETTPSLENFWLAIILLGRNVVSYKFALEKSLRELSGQDRDQVPLEQLAVPFARPSVRAPEGCR